MKNKECGIIYGVRCTVNQKWYIGQTVNYKQRKQNHLTHARYNHDRCVFHAAIRQYGEDCFEWTVLEYDIHTYDELNEAEKYWIREKNSLFPNGYNMKGGGCRTANHHHSEETRKRISIANKGKNKGKKRSEEARKRLSEARKGIKPVNRKPVLMFNRNGDFVAEFPSLRAAADYIGVKHSQVSDVLRGKHKTAGGGYDKNAGYTFKYKNENPDR